MTTWVPVPYLVERETTPALEAPSSSSTNTVPAWQQASGSGSTNLVQMPGWQLSLPESKPVAKKKEEKPEVKYAVFEGTREEIINPDFNSSKYEVRIPDSDDRPIAFTDAEIEEIADSIPNVDAGDSFTAAACREGLKENLRYQLRRQAIAPSAKDLDRLKDNVEKRYHAARIKRGTSVGTTASSNVGSNVTQMSFDAFKALGGDDGGMGSGVRGMKNILYAVMNRHDPSSIIHFNMLVNARDVIDISGRIVETFVDDFVEKKEILPFSHEYEGDSTELRAQRYWWHDMYTTLTGHPLPDPMYIMRLHLNRPKMYEFRVTPAMLAKSIETEKMSKNVEKEAAEGSMFAVVYSPLEDGILDIIPDEYLLARNWASAKGFMIPFLSQLYLSTVVKPGLKNLRLGGIPGIKAIIPVKVDIGNIFSEYMRLNPNEIRRLRPIIESRLEVKGVHDEDWEGKVLYATISKRNMVAKGLSYKNMLVLAELSKIVIIQEKQNVLGKPVELLVYVPTGMNIAEHFNNFVAKNKDNTTPLVSNTEMMGNRSWTLGEYIEALNTYTYAFTKGSNLLEVLKIPWVDKKRTICNNMHEIVQIFGIEATQIYIAGSLVGVLEGSGISASSVAANSRHIMLISDFMTNKGLPYGATYSGNTRQGKGVISAASIERSMIEFLNTAPYNKTETINSAASAQWTGTTIAAGSCAGLQFTNKEDVQEYRAKIQKDMEAMRRRQESRDPEKVHLYRKGKSASIDEAGVVNISTMMRNIGGEEEEEEEYMQDTSSFFDPTRPMPVRKEREPEPAEDIFDPIKILDPDSKEASKLTMPNPPKTEVSTIKNVALQQVIDDSLKKLTTTNIIPLTIPSSRFRSHLSLPDVEKHQNQSLLSFVKSKLVQYGSKIQEMYREKHMNIGNLPLASSPGYMAPVYKPSTPIFSQPDFSTMSPSQLNKEVMKSVPLPSFISANPSTPSGANISSTNPSVIPSTNIPGTSRGSSLAARGSGLAPRGSGRGLAARGSGLAPRGSGRGL